MIPKGGHRFRTRSCTRKNWMHYGPTHCGRRIHAREHDLRRSAHHLGRFRPHRRLARRQRRRGHARHDGRAEHRHLGFRRRGAQGRPRRAADRMGHGAACRSRHGACVRADERCAGRRLSPQRRRCDLRRAARRHGGGRLRRRRGRAVAADPRRRRSRHADRRNARPARQHVGRHGGAHRPALRLPYLSACRLGRDRPARRALARARAGMGETRQGDAAHAVPHSGHGGLLDDLAGQGATKRSKRSRPRPACI